MRDPGDNNLTQ